VQKVGDVAPKGFWNALNEKILPSLGIKQKSPLFMKTACQWLIKLGWRLVRPVSIKMVKLLKMHAG
jgi:hypothetical protein